MRPKYSKSQTYKDFEFKKVTPLSEINAILYELVHKPTGAQVLHIEADDPENVFCLSFKTYPSSDNGVAHILEHTVLCGSKNFPVKDPFFSMNRRSLNTFMNAFTGSDFTCYPAASQVEKDFYNLLEVYLDAVFYPELKEMSFLQEGHRFEFEKPSDPESDLTYKGIVFNEMKGALNQAESRLWNAIQKALYPQILYKYNSGGDPAAIPSLTHEQLKEFHSTYYHPSQCLFYFYGDLPIEKNLDMIEEKVLKQTKKQKQLPNIEEQPRAKKRQKIKGTFPSADESAEGKSFITFSWLTTHIKETVETLALCLLDSVLMENDAALLKMALQESKMTVTADGFIETDMSEIPYAIICRGCDPEKADELEKLMFQELKKIAKKGIPQKKIDAVYRQFELARLEITKDGGPYGLSLFMRSGLLKQHGGNPEDALKVHSLLDELKEKLKDEKYLPELIKKHLIDNHHYIRHVMTPDSKLGEQEQEAENKKLKTIESKLNNTQKEEIVGIAQQLAKFQEEEEDIECLPKLELKDVPKKVVDYPIKFEAVDQLALYTHKSFTNGLTYVDLVFDLYDTPMEDLHILKLFTSIITEVGSGIRDYKENLEYIQSFTGGLYASVSLNPLTDKPTIFRPTLSIHGKALSQYTDHLFSIIKDTTLLPKLDDTERLKELIIQIHTYLRDKLNNSALSYAVKSAMAPFSEYNTIMDQMSGLPYYNFIRDIAENIEEKLEPTLVRLRAVKEKLFHLNNPHLVMTCEKDVIEHIHKKEFYKIPKIPSSPFSPWIGNVDLKKQPQMGKLIASPVAFTCKAYPTFTYTNPLSAALYLATYLMENKVLHQKIREQGGAYGSGATYQPHVGNFYFYSYRDPNLESTLSAFDLAIKEISKGNFTDQDILEAKLGLIQGFDQPVSIGSKAHATYFMERRGRTKEVRQAFRDQVLGATKEQICESVKEALVGKEKKSQLSVFASKEFFDKEKSDLKISDV